jgi:hypothetical protein
MQAEIISLRHQFNRAPGSSAARGESELMTLTLPVGLAISIMVGLIPGSGDCGGGPSEITPGGSDQFVILTTLLIRQP